MVHDPECAVLYCDTDDDFMSLTLGNSGGDFRAYLKFMKSLICDYGYYDGEYYAILPSRGKTTFSVNVPESRAVDDDVDGYALNTRSYGITNGRFQVCGGYCITTLGGSIEWRARTALDVDTEAYYEIIVD